MPHERNHGKTRIHVAVAGSIGTVWLAFRLRDGDYPTRSGAAALMGVAIAGMHYTGTAAKRLTP